MGPDEAAELARIKQFNGNHAWASGHFNFIRPFFQDPTLPLGVGLVVRFGAATRQPVPWVSFGTGLVLVCWVLTSIGFGLYATYVASYTSVFGHLASVFVLLLYLWLSANAFLVGIQLDACVRQRA